MALARSGSLSDAVGWFAFRRRGLVCVPVVVVWELAWNANQPAISFCQHYVLASAIIISTTIIGNAILRRGLVCVPIVVVCELAWNANQPTTYVQELFSVLC